MGGGGGAAAAAASGAAEEGGGGASTSFSRLLRYLKPTLAPMWCSHQWKPSTRNCTLRMSSVSSSSSSSSPSFSSLGAQFEKPHVMRVWFRLRWRTSGKVVCWQLGHRMVTVCTARPSTSSARDLTHWNMLHSSRDADLPAARICTRTHTHPHARTRADKRYVAVLVANL